MKLLIVPKPVLNDEVEVRAYCFRFNRADEAVSFQPSRAFDGAMSSPCFDVLNMAGLDAFTNGAPIFVPLNKIALLTNVENQCKEPPEKIIFMLDEGTPPEEPFLGGVRRLRGLGFGFAAENITDYGAMRPLLSLCDFIFIDAETAGEGIARKLKGMFPKAVPVAANVGGAGMFRALQRDWYELFEGGFYSVPVSRGYNALTPVKVNSIQLMNLVQNEDFEIEEVAQIVGRDPSLSIQLLRLANSALSSGQKIRTIQHAVAMLGQKEVRKWVTTAVSQTLASDKPGEITKLSLMRAKFAENLAPLFEMAASAQSLFLMGLFSILDVVLEMPMDKALEIVTVSDGISAALVGGRGGFGSVLNFITTYETANWSEASRQMVLRGLGADGVFGAYIEAVKWYGSLASAANGAGGADMETGRDDESLSG